ncbi:MAG: hypothetical protein L3J39_00660 [Verrucomicrobiales bacterium]|nr:hypothetical protein [Verrucomicrobiales bacterium]
MSYADSITDQQKSIIQSWADEGDDLSRIQKKLQDELEIQVTYMEVRFLIGDLGIVMPSKEKPSEEVEEEEKSEPVSEEQESVKQESSEVDNKESDSDSSPDSDAQEPAVAQTSVKVTMSEVLPPDALAGGTVVFSDGMNANWLLNQMGQLSLDASDPAYRPSEADVTAFQQELQRVAKEKGM